MNENRVRLYVIIFVALMVLGVLVWRIYSGRRQEIKPTSTVAHLTIPSCNRTTSSNAIFAS